jgi:hypothetical protein
MSAERPEVNKIRRYNSKNVIASRMLSNLRSRRLSFHFEEQPSQDCQVKHQGEALKMLWMPLRESSQTRQSLCLILPIIHTLVDKATPLFQSPITNIISAPWGAVDLSRSFC